MKRGSRFIYLYFVLFILCNLIKFGETTTYQPEYFFRKLFATKTPYNEAKKLMSSYLEHTQDGLKSEPISEGNFYPPVCRPKQLSLALRHGTRYPSSGDVKRIAKFLLKLKDVELHSDFTELSTWRNDFIKDREKVLSESGYQENIDIASRFIENFPALFEAVVMDRKLFEFIASGTQRTKASADGFAQGMADKLSLSKDEVISSLELRNDLLRFFEQCDNYKYKVSTYCVILLIS